MEDCEWTYNIKLGYWETDCGYIFMFDLQDKGPINYHMKFCPYCGSEISQLEDYT